MVSKHGAQKSQTKGLTLILSQSVRHTDWCLLLACRLKQEAENNGAIKILSVVVIVPMLEHDLYHAAHVWRDFRYKFGVLAQECLVKRGGRNSET